MSSVDLKLDWCDRRAAKYAVEHWHYSRSLPSGKMAKFGVWENRLYLGSIFQCYIKFRGKLFHKRTVSERWGTCSLRVLKELDPDVSFQLQPAKHKYVMPLDFEMRDRIAYLAQPFPKSGQ